MKREASDRDDYYRRVSDLVDELRPTLPGHERPGPVPGRFRRIVVAVCIALLVAAALTYAVDYAVARVRLGRGSALSTIEVARLVAIPQKSGKTELDYAGSETVTCVRSIFPHFGYAPCWYVSRNGDVKF